MVTSVSCIIATNDNSFQKYDIESRKKTVIKFEIVSNKLMHKITHYSNQK